MIEKIIPILFRLIIVLSVIISTQSNASVGPVIWVTGKLVAQNVITPDSAEHLDFNTINTEVGAIGYIGINDKVRKVIFGVLPNTSSTIDIELHKFLTKETIAICSLMINVDDHLNAELLITDNKSPDIVCLIDQPHEQDGFFLKIKTRDGG